MVTTLQRATTADPVGSWAPSTVVGPPEPSDGASKGAGSRLGPLTTWQRRARRVEGVSLFLGPLGAYLGLGWLLAIHWHTYMGDGQARLANGFYVLYSRDPHLAAVGFVWQPLTSLAALPLLLLKGLWSPLSRDFFASNIMSALWMALAVHHVRKAAEEAGIATLPRLALTALFAFNPMILVYGANGMSEAPYVCFLVIATRYFVRWIDSDHAVDLVVAGTGLGLAYMARNEAVFAGAFATIAVFMVSWYRTGADFRRKLVTGLTDGTIIVAPFALCFVGWAAVSWIIVGHPFEQLQGQYGTASMTSVVTKVSGDTAQSPHNVAHNILALGPLLPTLIAVGFVLVVLRRDFRPLAAITVLGGGLLFSAWGAMTGRTGGFLRYYICAIPLSVMLAIAIAAKPGRSWRLQWTGAAELRRTSRVAPAFLALLAVAMTVPSVGTSWSAMRDSRHGFEEAALLEPLWHHRQFAHGPNTYYDALDIAKYMDSLRLPNGSVIVDNSEGCVPFVIVLSRHPAQFIIPNDRDFQKLLSDPVGFQVRYILAFPNHGLGKLDSVNRAIPSLYEDGGGIATLKQDLGKGSCSGFRLYKVNSA
jgi:hypothetical protein